MKIYENQKRIFALILAQNKKLVKGIENLDQIEYEFDPDGNIVKEPKKKKT